MISGGRKTKKLQQNETKPHQQNDPNIGPHIISKDIGWNKIDKIGIQPFFERVENMVNENKIRVVTLDKQQYIEVYDTIYTMCCQKEPYNYSSMLYTKHSESLTKQYKEKFIPSLNSMKTAQNTIFLKEWTKRWKCNKWNVIGMSKMFTYLDRFHVPNSEDLLNTTEQGHTLYKQIVYEPFKQIACDAILHCIQCERDGEEQDRELLRDGINVFVELSQKLKTNDFQIYRDDFHKDLIAQTQRHYKQKSRSQLDVLSCPDYLIFAEKCINAELDRLTSYIDKYSNDKLMIVTRDELLKNHQNELLLDKKTGINSIFDRTVGAEAQSAREDLSRIHTLYKEVDGGLDNVSDAMQAYITKLGTEFIEKSKQQNTKSNANPDVHELINQLIDLHDRYINIVKYQFKDEPIFHKSLKSAFEAFINKEYYTSSLLARFANDLLKKGTKIGNTSNLLETVMGHVVMLYGYIRDKDIFERDYQQYLASRLLQNLSESEQNERSMIGKLKNTAGYYWTNKLEDMFKDIQLSKELIEEFKKASTSNSNINPFECDLNVSICTTGSWPSSSIQPIKLPMDINKISDKFRQFYLHRFHERKLRYQMDKGKADCSVQFNAKCKKILVVSTYQMLILLLFNNKKTWSFGEIYEATGIPKEELEVNILSMAHPKIKVLRKSPNTKDIADDHKFQINSSYTNPRSRVIIPTLNIKSNIKIINEPDAAILTLRRHQMDAAIVRIMKARKTLKHQELTTEVIKQLIPRFSPKGSDIKKRIESLIDLEYLERDSDDRATYHYKQ